MSSVALKMTPTCASCAFYVPMQAVGTQVELGLCRRYPRSMDINHGHWCGEHALKITATPSSDDPPR